MMKKEKRKLWSGTARRIAAVAVWGVMALGLSLAPVMAGSDTLNVGQGLAFGSAKTDAPGPVAVRGDDVVSYFTDGKAQTGTAKYAASHDGAIYYFASEDHLKAFRAAPAKYLPQYGGFCAVGISQQTKFDGDPSLWTVHDGKLYLNVTPDVQEAFKRDVAGNVAKADKLWPSVEHKSPADLFAAWKARTQ